MYFSSSDKIIFFFISFVLKVKIFAIRYFQCRSFSIDLWFCLILQAHLLHTLLTHAHLYIFVQVFIFVPHHFCAKCVKISTPQKFPLLRNYVRRLAELTKIKHPKSPHLPPWIHPPTPIQKKITLVPFMCSLYVYSQWGSDVHSLMYVRTCTSDPHLSTEPWKVACRVSWNIFRMIY